MLLHAQRRPKRGCTYVQVVRTGVDGVPKQALRLANDPQPVHSPHRRFVGGALKPTAASQIPPTNCDGAQQSTVRSLAISCTLCGWFVF